MYWPCAGEAATGRQLHAGRRIEDAEILDEGRAVGDGHGGGGDGVGLPGRHLQHAVGGQRLAEEQIVDLRRLQPREFRLAGDLELAAARRDRHVVLAEQGLDLAVEIERHVLQACRAGTAACRSRRYACRSACRCRRRIGSWVDSPGFCREGMRSPNRKALHSFAGATPTRSAAKAKIAPILRAAHSPERRFRR